MSLLHTRYGDFTVCRIADYQFDVECHCCGRSPLIGFHKDRPNDPIFLLVASYVDVPRLDPDLLDQLMADARRRFQANPTHDRVVVVEPGPEAIAEWYITRH